MPEHKEKKLTLGEYLNSPNMEFLNYVINGKSISATALIFSKGHEQLRKLNIIKREYKTEYIKDGEFKYNVYHSGDQTFSFYDIELEKINTCIEHDLPYKFMIDGKKSCNECKNDVMRDQNLKTFSGGCEHSDKWEYIDYDFAKCKNCLNAELKIKDIK